jgi:hypothetical protein
VVERYISKNYYYATMPFIDSTGIGCGITDCRFHEGLETLRCNNLTMYYEYHISAQGRGISLKTCPHFEKGEDGYTSEW